MSTQTTLHGATATTLSTLSKKHEHRKLLGVRLAAVTFKFVSRLAFMLQSMKSTDVKLLQNVIYSLRGSKTKKFKTVS